MPVKLQIIQASVISLLTALNTIVISLFLGLSTFCCLREGFLLGLQQATLGGWGHRLIVLLCHGGVCILNHMVLPVLCPLVSCLVSFCQSLFLCFADSYFTQSYLKTIPLFFLLVWSAWWSINWNCNGCSQIRILPSKGSGQKINF